MTDHAEGDALRPKRGRAARVAFSVGVAVVLLAVLEIAGRTLPETLVNARWMQRSARVHVMGFQGLDDLLEPDAELFWRLRPGLEARAEGHVGQDEVAFSVSTDEEGLRRVPVPENARGRVLFLGDSCTFGLGVDDKATVPALVQRHLGGVACLNGGCIGYSAYQGRKLLESRGPDWKADVVVITFGVNGDLVWDGLGDPEHDRRLTAERERWVNRSGFLRLARRLLGGDRPSATPVAEDEEPKRPRLDDAEYETAIRAMLAWCADHGSRAVLVLWPYRPQLGPTPYTTKQRVLQRVAEDEGVPLLDLVAVFRRHGGRTLFVDGVHASSRGTALVAQELIPVLRDALPELSD